MGTGLTLQAIGLGWIAAVSTPTTPYAELVAPFILSGIGMALFFAPVANVVLSAVRPEEEGQASGANNAIRELGGVFGVAVLASIFAHYGGYASAASFVARHVARRSGSARRSSLVGAVASFAIRPPPPERPMSSSPCSSRSLATLLGDAARAASPGQTKVTRRDEIVGVSLDAAGLLSTAAIAARDPALGQTSVTRM